jgi:hypothetical protein
MSCFEGAHQFTIIESGNTIFLDRLFDALVQVIYITN